MQKNAKLIFPFDNKVLFADVPLAWRQLDNFENNIMQ